MSKTEHLSFKVHPRVFDSLGSELVTNDFVAIIELVKNSYDAFASRIDIRFGENEAGKQWIEIEDDGQGMSKEIIRDVWCVVATPYRKEAKYSGRGRNKRRVSGEKGLGRLSAARLGEALILTTKAKEDKCWKVELNWEILKVGENFDKCVVSLTDISDESPFKKSGTILRIEGLNRVWAKDKLEDFDRLKDALSKFIAPPENDNGEEIKGFEIWVTLFGQEALQVEVQSAEFLEKAPYAIVGTFDGNENLHYSYHYSDGKSKRDVENEDHHIIPTRVRSGSEMEPPGFSCGPFKFLIRAWDLDSEILLELSERLNLKKKSGAVRKIIKQNSGIYLYRDSVIALPKSEKNVDWLGLDLRRVSEVGTRLSTSQIMGRVTVSAEINPDLVDTSNREGLAENRASRDFRDAIIEIVKLLEKYRSEDRTETKKEPPLQDLFEQLSPKSVISQVTEMADQGKTASEVVPVIEEYGDKVGKAVATIEKRFVYYSRLATIGILAAMVMHEIRNRTIVFGSFLSKVRDYFDKLGQKVDKVTTEMDLADHAIHGLERLADKFSPLATRSFGKKRRNCFIEEIIEESAEMRRQVINKKNIRVNFSSKPKYFLAVDLGDLSAIFLNLFDNAIYWLSESDKGRREIQIRVEEIPGEARLRVHFDDSGPGIAQTYLEKVFWPGVTTRPDGLGMGLTVAAEIVDQYGGTMEAVERGALGGASFIFDLPLSKREAV